MLLGGKPSKVCAVCFVHPKTIRQICFGSKPSRPANFVALCDVGYAMLFAPGIFSPNALL